MYIGQPVISTLKSECELPMINPQQVQNRRMQVMNAYRIRIDVVAVVIRFPPTHTLSYTSTGHPDRETGDVVVSPIGSALAGRCAAKLRGPDDQGVVETAPLSTLLRADTWRGPYEVVTRAACGGGEGACFIGN